MQTAIKCLIRFCIIWMWICERYSVNSYRRNQRLNHFPHFGNRRHSNVALFQSQNIPPNVALSLSHFVCMNFVEIQFSLFTLDRRKWIVVKHMHKIHWSTLLILETFIVHHLNINSNLWRNQCAANERVMCSTHPRYSFPFLLVSRTFTAMSNDLAIAFGYEPIGQKWHVTSHCNSFTFRFLLSIHVTNSLVCVYVSNVNVIHGNV